MSDPRTLIHWNPGTPSPLFLIVLLFFLCLVSFFSLVSCAIARGLGVYSIIALKDKDMVYKLIEDLLVHVTTLKMAAKKLYYLLMKYVCHKNRTFSVKCKGLGAIWAELQQNSDKSILNIILAIKSLLHSQSCDLRIKSQYFFINAIDRITRIFKEAKILIVRARICRSFAWSALRIRAWG